MASRSQGARSAYLSKIAISFTHVLHFTEECIMGCVYILKNPAMPDLIKIGYTTRTAEDRAKELYEGALGVPKPFVVVHINDCEEPQELEATVHKRLAEYRINKNREFFKYPADDVYQLLRDLQDRSYRRWTSHFLTRFKKKAETQ